MGSADDDDFVLGGEGSDITFSAGDSGINLRPSDSGLALDAPLELGGSAISSSLDLGEALAANRSGSLAGLSDLGDVEDFQLTPLSEVPADEDEEDSSQIIALEEVSEEPAEELFTPSGFGEPVGGLSTVAMSGSPGIATLETQFSGWQVLFLSLCFILIMLCGMMMIDLMRNMWSWDQPFSLNSGLIDGILGLLGLG
jgi:hypothetical protein